MVMKINIDSSNLKILL